jgi:RhtB (resistance to homoserine/threonine) family protein
MEYHTVMEYVHLFVIVGSIAFLAIASPGPDFLVVVKNALVSRSAGLYTSLGIGLGLCLHVAYSLAGIGFIISQSIMLYIIVKLCGAAYLMYLGISMMRSHIKKEADSAPSTTHTHKSPAQYVREGFLTNILNPKATLFFVGVFTQVIEPGTPLYIQSLLALEIVALAVGWFSCMSYTITHARVSARVRTVQSRFMKPLGAALILLGVKVALQK